MLRLVVAATLVAACRSLVLPASPGVHLLTQRGAAGCTRAPPPSAGFFDNLFQESEAQKAAKDAAFAEQQAMLERQRDPEKMAEYKAGVNSRRAKATQADAELKSLQKGGAGDALEEWQRLKSEGKVKGMDDTERDADSSRMGSEGLIADRIDEKLPYIDSGWVDEEAAEPPDLLGGLGKLFGGGK